MKYFYASLKVLFSIALLFNSILLTHAQQMDNSQLGDIFYQMSDTISGQDGVWEMSINNVPMICITDESHNRMRIISPIKEINEVTPQELKDCMEANFHSALDVKYAISNDIMWVAFIHPLAELTKDQVQSAVSQVYFANVTYGTSYTSTELVFPKQEESEESNEQKKKSKKSKVSKT